MNSKRNLYPFNGKPRTTGYDPAIGENALNVAFLLRREPDAVLRREAARKGSPKARIAARILSARLSRTREFGISTARLGA